MKTSPAKLKWVNTISPVTFACWTCYALLQCSPKASKLNTRWAALLNISRVTLLPAFLLLQMLGCLSGKPKCCCTEVGHMGLPW